MGIGISEAAAELWKLFNEESYNENYVEEENGYVFFTELPDWAYDPDEGPFYIDDYGSIYAISTRPSQKDILIGNLV